MIDQVNLFKSISEKFKTNAEMYRAVGKVLNITPEAVKKIAYGKTALLQCRFATLVNAYEIPSEKWHLSRQKSPEINLLTFHRDFIQYFMQYVKNELRKMEQLVEAKDATICLSSDEVPVFHTIRYPGLTCFKLYCFAYDEIGKQYTFEAFMREVYTAELEQYLKKIADCYLAIPSTEIWHKDALDSMRYQIPYKMDLRAFEDWDTAWDLTKELELLLAEARQYAQEGEKNPNVRCALFRRHFTDSPPMVLVESSKGQYVYTKLDKFNYISLSEDHFQPSKQNFKKVLQQSISCGLDGILEQVDFFDHMGKVKNDLQMDIRKRT